MKPVSQTTVLSALLWSLLGTISGAQAAVTIPTQAWSRDIAATGYGDGAPIGGFGAGTITWKYNGAFYKTRLNIGAGNDSGSAFTEDATAKFYLYSKPAGGAVTYRKLDAATLGAGQATYYGLFPKAWVDYSGSQFPVKARVTQFSPIIPNDYQRVSYPVGIYQWDLTNPTATSQDVAIMLTWQNNFSGASASVTQNGTHVGIVLKRSGTGNATASNQGEFTLASDTTNGVTVTYESAAAVGTLETDFQADGLLNDAVGANTIGAVAFKVTLAAGATIRVPIVLAWDIPIAQTSTSTGSWYRQYTRYFGNTGLNSWGVADEALTNAASWESQIDTWMNGILTNATYPTWLKTMLFNEMYIYFTSGTMWTAGPASGQAYTVPSESWFSHLESYIYSFYGTSDVRFYGSWALFLNWPDIDKQAVKMFCDSVWNNRSDRPAGLGTTAHDCGDLTSIWTKWNAYTYRDSTTWKDLNSKLVLMVYRDYKLTGGTDTAFLNYCYKPVTIAMAKVKSQDTDGDGLPNSSGIDQTYDDMDLTGNTAYCGGLFLAACQAAKQLALAMGDTATANQYQSWYDLAQPNYESKLWTGSYYQIDTGSTVPTRIMSDQLCGEWYSKALGLGGIVTDAHAQTAFNSIYANNFQKFDTGNHGVVNVMTAAGAIDTSTSQTQEAWVGPTWGVVSGMEQLGMTAPASTIGYSLFNTIWNTNQFWYRTPEAWTTGVNNVRAYYYMRGSTIWGVKQALDLANPQCGAQTCTPTRTPTSTWTPGPTNTFTPTPTVNPCASVIQRVNCGYTTGPVTTGGNVWAADQPYTVGGWGYMTGTAETAVGNAIANTTDDVLYQTGRYNTALEYRFTVPNGTYNVTLKFAEIYYGTANSRVFNVAIEGAPVLSNFDIFAAAGGEFTAYDRTFPVTVADGVLNITTTAITDNPKFSAIEITNPSNPCSPTNTPTVVVPTATFTLTPTRTATFTPTATPSATRTFTATPTTTASSTRTFTSTPTATVTTSSTASFTATRTLSPTATSTPSPTSTYTPSPTPTSTLTPSPSPTPTPSRTLTWSPTSTPTNTATSTWTRTWTPTATASSTTTSTPIPSATSTLTPSPTATWTATSTSTRTSTVTATATRTPSFTPTPTSTNTWTPVPSATMTPTPSATPTQSSTPTSTWTSTSTPTSTPSLTLTLTSSATPTKTMTLTSSPTPTPTASSTWTPSPTRTDTPTYTWTASYTETLTFSPTATLPPGTDTPTPAPTDTDTLTYTPTSSYSPTWTESPTSSWTATSTSTPSWTPSFTPTVTPTPTWTWTVTASWTPTPTSTATVSFTGTPTKTHTPSATPTATGTATPSPTSTWTPSPTPTPTWTATWTPTPTWTFTPTFTFTRSFTNTPTFSFTPSWTPTPTYTFTVTWTPTLTPSWTSTATVTDTATPIPTPTATSTESGPCPNLFLEKPVVFPNPVWSDTETVKLHVDLCRPVGSLTVKIITTASRVARTVEFGPQNAGVHDLVLNLVDLKGSPLSDSTYHVRVDADGTVSWTKLLILR